MDLKSFNSSLGSESVFPDDSDMIQLQQLSGHDEDNPTGNTDPPGQDDPGNDRTVMNDNYYHQSAEEPENSAVAKAKRQPATWRKVDS